MEAIQKVANEAATKAVIEEVNNFYTGYNSPYRKQVKEWLAQNAPSLMLELPEFGELVQQSLKAEIDKIVKTISIENYARAIREDLSHQNLNEDGTLNITELCEAACDYAELDDHYDDGDDSVDMEITDDNTYGRKKRVTIKIVRDGDEKEFNFSLYPHDNKQEEQWQIIGMPYATREDGLYYDKVRVHTPDKLTIELPGYCGVSDNKLLMAIARCVMFRTPIRINKSWFSRSRYND